ncbi:hypothetical protein [Mucilaginibacter sp.]|uniref:hypothetical protein n=1 Tax=Mucilaginibacter sp. TaxID=1882438 RepID=UPI0035BC6694
MAPPKVDLSKVKFNENVEVLLNGIAIDKTPAEHGIAHYKVKDKSHCSFAGANMEFSVSVGTQNKIVASVYAETEKTASTNQVLKYLIATYHQPTSKITDDGDTRAYYWKTPQLFIRFMSGEVKSPTDGKQISSFVHIATLKALKDGVEPDLLRTYQFIQNN